MRKRLERYSVTGIRNQITLPKIIRDKAGFDSKVEAWIKPMDDKEFTITLTKPEAGTSKKLKVSEKGQLVIPQYIRESFKIKEGTAIKWSVKGTVITGKVAVPVKEVPKFEVIFNFLNLRLDQRGVSAMYSFVGLEGNDGIALVFKDQQAAEKNVVKIIAALEDLLECRLMAEKLGNTYQLRIIWG